MPNSIPSSLQQIQNRIEQWEEPPIGGSTSSEAMLIHRHTIFEPIYTQTCRWCHNTLDVIMGCDNELCKGKDEDHLAIATAAGTWGQLPVSQQGILNAGFARRGGTSTIPIPRWVTSRDRFGL